MGERLKLFGDLENVDFDGSLPFKEGDENTDFATFFINSIDSTNEVGEGTTGDLNHFTGSESSLESGLVFLRSFEDLLNFSLGDGGGLIANAHEASNSLGGTDGNPGIIFQNHLDVDITGVGLFIGLDLGTMANDHF